MSAGTPVGERVWEPVREHGELPLPIESVTTNGKFDFYPEATRLFSVRFKDGQLVIQPAGLVGWVAISDRLGLDIRPRVPVSSLDRLLTTAGLLPEDFPLLLRRYATDKVERPHLRKALVDAFVDSLRELDRQGVMQRYELRSASTSFPKGRIDVLNTVRREWARGRRDRVVVSYFARDVDIGPNQLLRLAVQLLMAQQRDGKNGQALALRRAEAALAGATPTEKALGDPDVVDPRRIPAIRAYYEPLIELAKVIVQGHYIRPTATGDEVSIPSLLFSLDDVFEAYARAVLKHELRDLSPAVRVVGGKARPKEGAKKALYDDATEPDAEPDIVVQTLDPSGEYRTVLILEAKYITRDFAREHAEQAISYSVSYRCPVILLRPKSKESDPAVAHVGSIGDVRIDSMVLDLGGDMESEERRFGQAVAAYLERLPSRRRGRSRMRSIPVAQDTLWTGSLSGMR